MKRIDEIRYRQACDVPVLGMIRPLYTVQMEYVLMVYKSLEWNKTKTADQLGISLCTLRQWLKELEAKGFRFPRREQK